MIADKLISQLESVRSTGGDRWIARCPAHEDKSPSLAIREVEDRLFLFQVGQVAFDYFTKECRFERAEGQVCERIAIAVIEEEPISRRLLEHDHGDVEVVFLYDYTRIVLRNFLRDIWLKYRDRPEASWIDDLFDERRLGLLL